MLFLFGEKPKLFVSLFSPNLKESLGVQSSCSVLVLLVHECVNLIVCWCTPLGRAQMNSLPSELSDSQQSSGAAQFAARLERKEC